MSFRILAYHQIADNGKGHPYTIHPDVFRQQMRRIANRGGRGLTINRAMEDCGEHDFALSFDDGTIDFYEIVLPILKEFDFAATLFLIPGLVGKYATWPEMAGVPMMTWEQIRYAIQTHWIEVGSHTWSHKALIHVSAKQIKDEIGLARLELEDRICTDIPGLAYPFGVFNDIAEIVAIDNHEYACTSKPGKNHNLSDKWALRRNVVRADRAFEWFD